MSAAESPLTTSVSFSPVADGYVNETSPDGAFGTSAGLLVDDSPQRMWTYLRFDVRGIAEGTVRRATLRLHAFNGTSDGPAVYETSNEWEERSLTWKGRPSAVSGLLDDAGSFGSGTWVEFDVTAAVQKEGALSFVLVPSSANGADFYSREASVLRPELVVVSEQSEEEPPDGGETCTPTREDVIVSVNADTYVNSGAPAQNFGAAGELLVDASPREYESYLRFDTRALEGTLERVVLRLFAFNGSSSGPALHAASTDWLESAVSWNARPVRGTELSTAGSVSAGSWVDFDVTAQVRAERESAFALIPTATNGLDFYSRESSRADLRPHLVATVLRPCDDGGGDGGESPPPRGEPQTLTLAPAADTYVSMADFEEPQGRRTELLVDTSPHRYETYVRFEVDGVVGTVTSARLRLYAFNGTSDGPAVHTTGSSWSEDSLVWNGRAPASEEAIANVGPIASNAWVEIDVSSVVKGNGAHAFVLLPESSNGADFYSREWPEAALRPQLVLTVEEAPEEMLERYSFAPNLDLYVYEDQPDTSFHSEPVLQVGGAPDAEAYFWLTASPLEGRIRRALLRLHVSEGTVDGPALFETEAWSSTRLTWNTRPQRIGTALEDEGPLARGEWVEYDVTSILTRTGAARVALIPTSGDWVSFHSTEAADPRLRPELVVWAEPVAAPPADGAPGSIASWTLEGGAGTEEFVAMVADSHGGFVAVGADSDSTTPETVDDPPRPSQMVIARYGANGGLLWKRSIPVVAAAISDVALTPEGNLHLVGSYADVLDLGTGPLPPAERLNMFVAKLSPTGDTLWARGFSATRIGSNGDTTPGRIVARAVTSDRCDSGLVTCGSLIVGGDFEGVVDLGGGPIASDGGNGHSTFVAKFRWDGAHEWSTHSRLAEDTVGTRSLATDAEGNVFQAGALDGTPFIAKYSPSGQALWRKTLDGAWGSVSSIAAWGTSVVFTGSFVGSLGFGGETREAASRDVMLGAIGAGGEDRWFSQFSSPESESGTAVTVLPDGSVVLLGRLAQALDLGGGPISGGGGDSMGIVDSSFVAKFSAGGEHRWSRAFDPNVLLRDAAALSSGGLMTCGSVRGSGSFEGEPYTAEEWGDALILQLRP